MLLSRVWLLATPWTAAYQAPLSMRFSRQEYSRGGAIAFSVGWSGLSQIYFSDLLVMCPWVSYLISLTLSFLIHRMEEEICNLKRCLMVIHFKYSSVYMSIPNFFKMDSTGPLYSTGSSAQCYVAAWMGGEFGREWIAVHVWLSPFPVHVKLHSVGNQLLLLFSH